MLIVMNHEATQPEIETVVAQIASLGFKAHLIPGENRLAIGVTGNIAPIEGELFTSLSGVKEAIPVTKPYKLAGRDFKIGKTKVTVGKVVFGGPEVVIIAGPCAVESESQTLRIAEKVRAGGAMILRGGAFKPRTSPYSFQGMGEAGLKILAKARELTGLPFITEAVDPQSLELVAKYADIIQIGARNMQNFSLLQEAGRLRKPVMLKRGLSATIEEWLQSAEYILSEGNTEVILCERGIRSFDNATRNILDLSAVVAVALQSHLPVVVDPSHGTGRRPMIAPMAYAAAACGAAGVMMDVHDRPKEALCDGPQAISPEEFTELVVRLKKVQTAVA